MLTAIVGINWGDEGKGRMVDLLSEEQDIVVRYQGGNNAGHTVVNHLGKFILNLLPSGILREDVVCVMGNGMVIDIEHLAGEVKRLTDAGVKITPDNLKISDKAQICMPYHVALDRMEEQRLKDKKFGSTGRGISPVYGDKYMKKGIRMGDLLHPEYLESRLKDIVDFKSLTVEKVYGGEKLSYEAMLGWLKTYGDIFKPFICDTSIYLDNALKEGKKVMLEAQLGALRDIDFGIYPYTSSSSTIAAYGPVGSGIPNHKLDLSIGIMKAYSSCVGEGPFTVEMWGDEAEALREAGGEYGAATGRPRRVGAFDAVASRYGVRAQGADVLALTKMDVLSYLDQIPVCTAYEIDGVKTFDFPTGEALNKAKPVIEYMPGWHCDISGVRSFEDLPKEARDYVLALEELAGCPIKYVSVGAERDAYIER
ncbi:MAG: adenylosuccinate synthase [Clostridia bacterium]|nr:adenylosuccinate synthase [Clostridia bacterium]MBQ8236133.1 adenylosuccinate synthase [Clostridia bacterium]